MYGALSHYITNSLNSSYLVVVFAGVSTWSVLFPITISFTLFPCFCFHPLRLISTFLTLNFFCGGIQILLLLLPLLSISSTTMLDISPSCLLLAFIVFTVLLPRGSSRTSFDRLGFPVVLTALE